MYGDINIIDEKGKVYSEQKYPDYPTVDDFIEAMLVRPLVPVKNSALMFRRESIVAVGNYDLGMQMDYDNDLVIRVARKFGYVHIPEKVVNFRTHKKNITLHFSYRLRTLKYKWMLIDRHLMDPSKKLEYKLRILFTNLGKFFVERLLLSRKPKWLLEPLSRIK